jgi:hypothetical protein
VKTVKKVSVFLGTVVLFAITFKVMGEGIALFPERTGFFLCCLSAAVIADGSRSFLRLMK